MIHCIGDSHVAVFSGMDLEDGKYCDTLPLFRTHYLGPHTAFNLPKRMDAVGRIIRDHGKPGDSVMLCFGEIDCRAHLVRQSEIQGRPLEEVVDECADQYFQVVEFVRNLGFPVLVWNVVPARAEEIVYGEYSSYGSCAQRNRAASLLNERLRYLCGLKDAAFISIFEKLLDRHGKAQPVYYADDIHLSQQAMPLIMEEMDRLGLLPISERAGRETNRVEMKERTPVHLINIVYEHLTPAHSHARHRGDVTVLWSSAPVGGCDIYAYLNAHSFRGARPGINVLLLFEPPVVLPGQFDEAVWARFDQVFTFYDFLVKDRPGFHKILAPRSGWVQPVPVTEQRREREEKYPVEGRVQGICMINGNKKSAFEGELYSKRLETAEWFHEHSAMPFHLYGNPPFTVAGYRGSLSHEDKFPTLASYRYCLCFENMYHPVYSAGFLTEKVLDCLETRTIPIYLGCSNVEEYIPKDCFIDFRDFRNLPELERFLAEMSNKRYKRYIKAMDEWVGGGGLRLYSWEALYDQLAELVNPGEMKDARPWGHGESTLGELNERAVIQSPPIWTYRHLAETHPAFLQRALDAGDAAVNLKGRVGPLANGAGVELSLGRIKTEAWSLKPEFLALLQRAFGLETFVETGTYMGNTTAEASRLFKEVHTVELSPSLYDKARRRFKGKKNVFLYRGDSVTVLPGIIEKVKGRALLWLDAHFSEGVTEKTEKNSPILEELEAVRASGLKDALILVDDLRFFQEVKEGTSRYSSLRDYPTIEQLCEALIAVDQSFVFTVVGDLLMAYRPLGSFGVSPVLRGCTVSRFFDGKNFPINEVMEAEEAIASAEAGEREVIAGFLKESLVSENLGLGGHYKLWHGLTLAQSGHYDEACNEFLGAIRLGCSHWRIQLYLARSAFLGGNYVLSRRALDRVLEESPDFPEAVKLLQELENKEEAGGPGGEPLSGRARLALASQLQEEGRYNEAIDEVKKAMEAGITDVDTRYRYAQLFIVSGRYDEAEIQLKDVIKYYPRHTFAYNDLGVLAFQRGERERALEHYKLAVSCDNRNYNALKNLLTLLMEMEKMEEAVYLTQALMGQHPSDRQIRALVKDFGLPDLVAGDKAGSPIGPFDGDPQSLKAGCASYYREMVEAYRHHRLAQGKDSIVHPVWRKELDTLGALITNTLPDNFLLHPVCLQMFVRTGWNKQQEYELAYLRALPGELRGRMLSLHESDVGAIPRDCRELPLSVNTLGMLWYYARITGRLVDGPSSIVELGGGFGSLARIFMVLSRPAPTYTIIDLPEMLALQYYYLSLSLGTHMVVRHVKAGEPMVPGKVNLVPVYGVEDANPPADLFISTFALSETPAVLQRLICENKGYFGASCLYITGQLPGERPELKWEDPGIITVSALRRFRQVRVDRFHIGENYELAASAAPFAEDAAGTRYGRDVKSSGDGESVAVVFSKDRAMQLDATLASFYARCNDGKRVAVKVLYTTSSEEHARQYEILREAYPDVHFEREGDFKKNLLDLLSSFRYVLFLVDDNLFVRDFSLREAERALEGDLRALGFSLRLGRNTGFCYMLNREQSLPPFEQAGPSILRYRWIGSACDFGYPLEVSSSLYRLEDIKPLLEQMEFRNPNTLEALLDANKDLFAGSRDMLLCPDLSVTFCAPVNKVQKVFIHNRGGAREGYSSEKLSALFEQGFRIDVERFRGFEPGSCHQEVELHFRNTAPERGTQETPLVSILILNYNGSRHISPCLDSIRRNTPERHEIIVIDNASTDDSRTVLRSRPEIILVENQENIGCPPARAQALSLARGEYVVFLDNDTIVTEGWLGRFIAHARKDRTIGIMGPRSNYVSGAQLVPEVPYQDSEGLEAFAGEMSARHRDSLTPSLRLVGFCMFVTRQVVDRIGSMDRSFGKFGFEDDDYTWRANVAGFKTAIANDIFIHHTGGPQGGGDRGYNNLLMEAWGVFKRKWGLPAGLPYGKPFDVAGLLKQPFNKKKHFIPVEGRSTVEPLIYCKGGYDGPSPVDEATSLLGQGRTEEAIGVLEKALLGDGQNSEILNDLAVLYYRKGEKEKAHGLLKRVADMDPSGMVGVKNLADLCNELGRKEEAVDGYLKVLDLAPDDVEALVALGFLSEEFGQRESALTFFRRVLDIDPANPAANAFAAEREGLLRSTGTGTGTGALS